MSQYLDNTGLATLWSKIKSVFAEKASTLSGYGITDAYTKTEIDSKIGDVESILAEINGGTE